MATKVTKTTTKGQITLPSEWRKQFATNNFVMKFDADMLVIKPVLIEEIGSEDVIFDADRDNSGNGVPLDEMIKLLKKVKNG